MRPLRATAERDLDAVRHATAHHGIVTTPELLAFGFSRAAVKRRTQAGRLHRLHRGVHSIVPPELLSIDGRWLAAVLAAGPGALLSHRAAAALWDLRPVGSGAIEVTVAGEGGRRPRPGLVVHRSRTLGPHHRAAVRSIPVTSPRRTLDDLRRCLPAQSFRAAVRQAEILRLDTGPIDGFTADRARSELERRVLRIIRGRGLPVPEVNAVLLGFEVDLLWREPRLVAEIDSRRFHAIPTAFERDRARDAALLIGGYRTVRFTERQIEEDPAGLGTTLDLLLRGANGSHGDPSAPQR